MHRALFTLLLTALAAAATCTPRCLDGAMSGDSTLYSVLMPNAPVPCVDCQLSWSVQYTPCNLTFSNLVLRYGNSYIDTSSTSTQCVSFGSSSGLRLAVENVFNHSALHFEWHWEADYTTLCTQVLIDGLADDTPFKELAILNPATAMQAMYIDTLATLASDQVECSVCNKNGVLDAGEACDPTVEQSTCCSDACTLLVAGTACDTSDDDENECTSGRCSGASAQCVHTHTPETCADDCAVRCISGTVALVDHDDTDASPADLFWTAKFVPCNLNVRIELTTVLGDGATMQWDTPVFECVDLDNGAAALLHLHAQDPVSGALVSLKWTFPNVGCVHIARVMFDASFPDVTLEALAHTPYDNRVLSTVAPSNESPAHASTAVCLPSDITNDVVLCYAGSTTLHYDTTSGLVNPAFEHWPCDPSVSNTCALEWAFKLRLHQQSIEVLEFEAIFGGGGGGTPYQQLPYFEDDTEVRASVQVLPNGAYMLHVYPYPSNGLQFRFVYTASYPWQFSTELPSEAFRSFTVLALFHNAVFLRGGQSPLADSLLAHQVDCPSPSPSPSPSPPPQPLITRAIVPFVTCASDYVMRGRCLTIFGYTNANAAPVFIGANTQANRVTPKPDLVFDQTELFLVGTVDEAFAVMSLHCKFPNGNERVKWQLNTTLSAGHVDTECSNGCGDLSNYLQTCILSPPSTTEDGTASRCARARHDTPRCTSEQVHRWIRV